MFGPKRTSFSLIFLLSVGLSPQKTSSANEINFFKKINYTKSASIGGGFLLLCCSIFYFSNFQHLNYRIQYLQQVETREGSDTGKRRYKSQLLKKTIKKYLSANGVVTQEEISNKELCELPKDLNERYRNRNSRYTSILENLVNRNANVSLDIRKLHTELENISNECQLYEKKNSELKDTHKKEINNLKEAYLQETIKNGHLKEDLIEAEENLNKLTNKERN